MRLLLKGEKRKRKKEKKKACFCSFFFSLRSKTIFKLNTKGERDTSGCSATWPRCCFQHRPVGCNFRHSLQLGEQALHGQENRFLPLTAHAENIFPRCTLPIVHQVPPSGPSASPREVWFQGNKSDYKSMPTRNSQGACSDTSLNRNASGQANMVRTLDTHFILPVKDLV